ncbi:hypothetical protein YYE_04581 [Plasmodium vinckei vinckei]|uniref:PIR protein CIR protein n=1 Tax=Plasmodium vinckei vinckei TaxID=54757 RepID=A0A081I9P0_PLAVN|nr:hypothetical protein YYE_04581 [Plasmodium vinckei vinckei]
MMSKYAILKRNFITMSMEVSKIFIKADILFEEGKLILNKINNIKGPYIQSCPYDGSLKKNVKPILKEFSLYGHIYLLNCSKYLNVHKKVKTLITNMLNTLCYG